MKNQNDQAFLWTLRVSEGTNGPDGYRTIVGGSTFDNFADHPHVLIPLPNLGISSSAAGAYQIIRRTWDGVRAKLGLTDFSPASQDAAALELLRQRGALADVRAGRFATAIDKCKKERASLARHGDCAATSDGGTYVCGAKSAGGAVEWHPDRTCERQRRLLQQHGQLPIDRRPDRGGSGR